MMSLNVVVDSLLIKNYFVFKNELLKIHARACVPVCAQKMRQTNETILIMRNSICIKLR